MNIQELYEIFKQHPEITTDSRTCPVGSIFFALKGETFDGNAYAKASLEKGCAYAVVDEKEYADEQDERIILVDDALQTLQDLARFHREKLGTTIVGVTGSNGKTTTKELIAAVLQKKYKIHYTQGNFNNHIGVPKTLLQLTPEHEMAVVEMGANHPGEIKTLVNIVRPDFGIITSVGVAHIEGFGSFEGVVRTKGELYDFIREHGGQVFINSDNPHLMGISHGLQLVRYGRLKKEESAEQDPRFTTPHASPNLVDGELVSSNPFLCFKWNGHEVQTHLIGDYNIDNALAAATIGTYFDVPAEAICEALEEYVPSNNRSQYEQTAFNRLVIDAYNANPTSMHAALHNFCQMTLPHKMCILGVMRELGNLGQEEHQKLVDFLKDAGFEQVWLVGEEFESTQHPASFRLFKDVEEVKFAIAQYKPQNMTILIKGSNSNKLFELPKVL
ncbi:MAG: UDP-N-acetylmuramoyl-tripeptide--D-alanyl-D-alanine ligase [Bacteroidaceae bacterium]|nr:UDP-N-acetylmuramoyl-tripeptide--D-alanyl-D-alanine ligase [Bacteroidaceae bacterium]